jgi:hypothetical protein
VTVGGRAGEVEEAAGEWRCLVFDRVKITPRPPRKIVKAERERSGQD